MFLLLERTIQQVPLVALASNLCELKCVSGISRPILRAPFRNPNTISQHSGGGFAQTYALAEWLVLPARHSCIFTGPPVIADWVPVQVDIPLCHSPSQAALGFANQADLSWKKIIDFQKFLFT